MRGLPKGDAENQPKSTQEKPCRAFLCLRDPRSEVSNSPACSSERSDPLLDHIGKAFSAPRCFPTFQGSPAVSYLWKENRGKKTKRRRNLEMLIAFCQLSLPYSW